MSEFEERGEARCLGAWTGVIPACVAAGLLLSPALFAGFFGDDFVLWHFGRKLLDDPSKLLSGPENFYRPVNGWLFAIHQFVFGAQPLGYHIVTLAMHLSCGALLGLVLARFLVSPWAVFAGSAAWMCSPYAFEPVQYVNVAYNDLTVLLAWLGLAALWPHPGGTWGRGRLGAAVALVVFSAFCKESWVIVPGLVVAFELCLAHTSLRRALRTGLLLAIPAGAYVLAYPWIFPGRGGYYEVGLWALSRPSHLWASFSILTPLEPYRSSFGAMEFVALLLMAGCAVVGWKRRSRLVGLGFVFFVCSVAPILFIPYLPTRYTTAPLIGFVLVLAGVAREIVQWTPAPRKRLAVAGVTAVTLVFVSSGVLWLMGDFDDMERLRGPYAALIEEARVFVDQVPTDRPVVCVRLEQTQPLHRLHSEGSLGIPKLYYQRAFTPYGLADWAELFTFVRSGRVLVDLTPEEVTAEPHAVVGHVAGSFVVLEPRADNAAAELTAWTTAGYPARIVGPWRR